MRMPAVCRWFEAPQTLWREARRGLVMPTTMVLALDPRPDIARLASSLGGRLQMLIGGAMIALAGPSSTAGDADGDASRAGAAVRRPAAAGSG